MKERHFLMFQYYKKVKVKSESLSVVSSSVSPWPVARQASLSMEFSRPEYWSEQPFPSPGHLPDPAVEPRTPALQADTFPAEPPGKPKNTEWVAYPFPSRPS